MVLRFDDTMEKQRLKSTFLRTIINIAPLTSSGRVEQVIDKTKQLIILKMLFLFKINIQFIYLFPGFNIVNISALQWPHLMTLDGETLSIIIMYSHSWYTLVDALVNLEIPVLQNKSEEPLTETQHITFILWQLTSLSTRRLDHVNKYKTTQSGAKAFIWNSKLFILNTNKQIKP